MEYKHVPSSLVEWESQVMDHIEQIYTYNCGVFIIYFMYQFTNGISISSPENMDIFRKKIKQILLSMSDDMTQQCNICGEVCSMDISDIGKCKLCERLSHRRCSGTTDEICSLCNRFKFGINC